MGVVGDPFLDGLPRWFDGLHRLDIEGRRWRTWKLDDTFPQAVEAEAELDLLAEDDIAVTAGINRSPQKTSWARGDYEPGRIEAV